jgi:hypothetical protein
MEFLALRKVESIIMVEETNSDKLIRSLRYGINNYRSKCNEKGSVLTTLHFLRNLGTGKKASV